jgi:hypothetical protein
VEKALMRILREIACKKKKKKKKNEFTGYQKQQEVS